MKTPVAIVGGGPAGTCTALALQQLGIESVLIEKDRFPRYHIGESMTGECGKALRMLGLGDKLQEASRDYPVKHGVRVFGKKDNSFWVPVMDRRESGLEKATTWQVPRDDFDQLMLEEAVARGSRHLEGSAREPIRGDRGEVTGVRVELRNGDREDVMCDVLVDASGPACFLQQHKVTGASRRGRYDKQVALFSQVTGAIRDPGDAGGNTLIFVQQRNYWAWFIPLDGQRTSIGVVVPADYFKESGEDKRAFLEREMTSLHPELGRRLESYELVEEARAISNYSYEIDDYCGRGFLCVGDSHRFIDPVFSFGMHFAVKEGQFAAEAIQKYLQGHQRDSDNPFREYQELSTRGMDVIQEVLDAFWDHPFAFAYAVHKKHVEDMIDLFAGRVYGEEPSEGLLAIRKINASGAA